jgi:hypothetical protein
VWKGSFDDVQKIGEEQLGVLPKDVEDGVANLYLSVDVSRSLFRWSVQPLVKHTPTHTDTSFKLRDEGILCISSFETYRIRK